MRYFVCLIFEIMAMIVAYLTNPIVVLFADEYGELPECFKMWGTYDNRSLDVGWMITEHCVPKWAEYDYNSHYVYHYEKKFNDGTVWPGYVIILNKNFTLKERLQRYVCRACWLYRNSNYGFSYYVNGVDVNGSDLKVVKNTSEPNNEIFIAYEKDKDVYNTAWSVFVYKQYCEYFCFRAYLGWKLKGLSDGRHMLAFSVNPFRRVK